MAWAFRMTPKVSVVIKSFNHAAYVDRAIQSVLDQTFQDFEIVVIDDGSQDGTPDVIRRFTDSRISFEASDENRGISITMNALIRRARGEFIAILNSDDFFFPEKLAKQVQFLDRNPEIGAVFSLPKVVDEREVRITGWRSFLYPFQDTRASCAQYLERFFFHGSFLCAPTAMVRRSTYDKVGPYDPRFANLLDFDMWVRLCMVEQIHVIQEELSAFRIRDDKRNMSALRRDTILRYYFEYFEVLKHYRNLSFALATAVFAQAIEKMKIDVSLPYELWLTEIALTVNNRAHRLFALDTLFEATSRFGDHYKRLTELTGTIDVYGLFENLDVLPPASRK